MWSPVQGEHRFYLSALGIINGLLPKDWWLVQVTDRDGDGLTLAESSKGWVR